MTSETEALHKRLEAAGVDMPFGLLFKQFPAELLLEAIASRFIDLNSPAGWECGQHTYQNEPGIDIQGYRVAFSIGWIWKVVIALTKLEALTQAVELHQSEVERLKNRSKTPFYGED